MQFSYNWLQDFFEEKLPAPEEVAKQLGLHSFELEGIEKKDTGDYLIDWDVLPNRSSDCLCYEGIAREISAVFEIPYKSYLLGLGDKKYNEDVVTSKKLDFTLNTDLVKRATKRYAENIKVKESPEWLRTKIESIGQNSINNVVDITNYVMWVTGQPVHAFDYDKLAGGEVKNMTIRHAREGEEVIDLTGDEHKLDETMLVVADSEKALDVAGVRGGDNSGVDEGTTRVILSACNYDFKNIRYTSRKLKLQTDASKRYENEVPLHKATTAMMLLAHLIEKECDGLVSEEVIDTSGEILDNRKIELTVKQTNSLLGTELSQDDVVAILKRINVDCKEDGGSGQLSASVPDERLDLNIPQDLIEEVGRIFGLYNIPETPIQEGFTIPQKNITKQSWYKLGEVLAQLGFYEVYNRSLVKGGVVKLANSLNANADSLRTYLLPLLYEKIEKNFVHTETPNFFELGKVFTGVESDKVLEHWSFAGVLGRKKIKEKQKANMFYQTKGALETVFETLNAKDIEWEEAKENNADTLAILKFKNEQIGEVGVNFWEINFEKLLEAIDTSVVYYKPSKYPKMERDVAVFVPSTTTVSEVKKLIESAKLEKCPSVELFDIYEDTENNRKSFAFRVTFQCWVETLNDAFADEQMEKVYSLLKKQKNFEIR